MPIPTFQALLRPTLELLADRTIWRLPELEEKLAALLGITNADREVLLPSGAMPMFYNRVAGSSGISIERNWSRRCGVAATGSPTGA